MKLFNSRAPFFFDAIFIAHAGAAKMTDQGYTFTRNAHSTGTATIITPIGKRYRTHVRQGANNWIGYCTCPFAQQEGICKHQIWLGEQLDEEAEDSRRADEMTANLDNEDYYAGTDKIGN